jgi:hypothetical protein
MTIVQGFSRQVNAFSRYRNSQNVAMIAGSATAVAPDHTAGTHAALLCGMRGKSILGMLVLAGACATTTPPPATNAARSHSTVARAEHPGALLDPHAEASSEHARKTLYRVEAAQIQQQIRRLESPGH